MRVRTLLAVLVGLNVALFSAVSLGAQDEYPGTCITCASQQGILHCCRVDPCDGSGVGERCCTAQTDCFIGPE